jgi:hypothetical protein
MSSDKEKAAEFANTPRGNYILGQALYIAIETLNKVEPEVMREISNISDMEFIRDNLFPIYSDLKSYTKRPAEEAL